MCDKIKSKEMKEINNEENIEIKIKNIIKEIKRLKEKNNYLKIKKIKKKINFKIFKY